MSLTIRCSNNPLDDDQAVYIKKNCSRAFSYIIYNAVFQFITYLFLEPYGSSSLYLINFFSLINTTWLIFIFITAKIAKSKPNKNFSYGYSRFEVIFLFLNSLFLFNLVFSLLGMTTKFSSEKLVTILVMSILGFFINVIGICNFFGINVRNESNVTRENLRLFWLGRVEFIDAELKLKLGYKFTESEILMLSVFLHIITNLVGYLIVILSGIAEYFEIKCVQEPLYFIAIEGLITFCAFISAKTAVNILTQRQPKLFEKVLPGCYEKIMQLPNVQSIVDPHFWSMTSGYYIGSLKLNITNNENSKFILDQTHTIFSSIGVHQMTVELNYVQ